MNSLAGLIIVSSYYFSCSILPEIPGSYKCLIVFTNQTSLGDNIGFNSRRTGRHFPSIVFGHRLR